MDTEVNKSSKPPLGLMPKNIWLEDRLNEVNEAMKRYIEVDHQIPNEWHEERNWLIAQLQYGNLKYEQL